MGHKTSRQSFLSLRGDPECGPFNEMSTGCRWGGEESRTDMARQRLVPGGSGVSRLGALFLSSLSFSLFLAVKEICVGNLCI